MNFNKKKIILIILSIVFLSIVIFLIVEIFNKQYKVDEQDEDFNKEITLKVQKFTDLDNRPSTVTKIIPLNLINCEDEDSEIKKQECIDQLQLDVSVLGKNLKDCILIRDIKKRDDCIILISKQHETEMDSEKICQRIVNNNQKDACLTYLAIYRPYDLQNNICEETFKDKPFQVKMCKDKSLAMQIGHIIKDSDDIVDKINMIKKCTPDMALEYGILCMATALKTIDFNCDLLDEGRIKDYCVTISIFNNKEVRTKDDCLKMPLINHRKVCLSEIKEQKNRYKLDSDNDGASDGGELFYNIDPFNPDTDGDGLLDGDEIHKYGSNPADFDTDGDGLSDLREIEMGTNFHNPDSDGDGLIDSEDDNPLDKLNDSDEDRLSDSDEENWGTDPNNKDTDGDGTPDGAEIILYGTNPLGEGWQHDTDGDGLMDIDEVFYMTDRLNPDTDGDGINDGEEVKNLTNPLGEGDMDFDGDGLSDKEELKYGTNPSKKDTNDDGVNDLEAIQKGIEAVSDDTDNDGLKNLYEKKLGLDLFNPDMDNDGLLDGEEVNKYHADPNNPDTDGDGYLDGEEVKKGYNPNGEGMLKN